MVTGNIADNVPSRLKEKARMEGKSAGQLAREALVKKGKPPREQIAREIDAIRASTVPTSGEEINDEIRRDRDHNLGRRVPGLDD
jgi:hypothetical protein